MSTATAATAAAQRSNGVAIRALREACGLSLRDLATSAGISASQLSKAERDRHGRRPAALRGIAAALGVPLLAITREGTAACKR